MRRALVLGGAGFIGSHLAELLLEHGLEVVVLDDFSTGHASNLPEHGALRVVEGSIGDRDALSRAGAGADVAFHLAAHVGNVASLERPGYDAAVNVLGTLQVIEACAELGIPQLVATSSCAVYGEPRRTPIDEDHPLDPVSPYGISKLAAERYCVRLGAERGLVVAALRCFNVYGPRQRPGPYASVVPIFVRRALSGGPLTVYGDGHQTRDFIHVADVAEAHRLAFARRARGVFNVGTGAGTSVAALAGVVTRCAGRPLEVRREPERAGEVRHAVADVRRLRGELGHAPRLALEEGVASCFAWASGERGRRVVARS